MQINDRLVAVNGHELLFPSNLGVILRASKTIRYNGMCVHGSGRSALVSRDEKQFPDSGALAD